MLRALVLISVLSAIAPFQVAMGQDKKKEEITLGKVTTNAKMATPCGQGRKNPKAIMLEIEQEIKKHGNNAGSI